MKRLLTFILILGAIAPAFAQHALVRASLRNKAVLKPLPSLNATVIKQEGASIMKATELTPVEESIGMTRYDDQSNASMQNRLYLYEDGTMGATWIYGLNDPGFDDRGAGYNFFDGSAWMDYPTARVEDERCGWPSYAPWGESGEIIVSHTSASGYKISKRTTKGTGDWSYSLLPGPAGHEVVIWNRSITSGIDHNKLHVLSLTASDQYGGKPYQG